MTRPDTTIISKTILMLLLTLMPIVASAQDFEDGDGDGDDVNDEPAAPISGYIPVALTGALVLAYGLHRKQAQ